MAKKADPLDWTTKSRPMVWRGIAFDAYHRGALAMALNRKVVSIRALERKGIICHPPLLDQHQRWIYTKSQIEDLVQLAKEEGVINPAFKRPFSERFITLAHQILKRNPS